MKQFLKKFYPLTIRKFESDTKNRDSKVAAITADLAKIKTDLRTQTSIKVNLETIKDDLQVLAGIKAELDEVKASLHAQAALKTDLANIKADLDKVKTRLEAQTAYRTDLTNIKANLGEVKASLQAQTSFKTDLANIKTALDEVKVSLQTQNSIKANLETIKSDLQVLAKIKAELDEVKTDLQAQATLKTDLANIKTNIQTTNTNSFRAVSNLDAKITKSLEDILSQLALEKNKLDEISSVASELLWADTFNSTLTAKDKRESTYSPGRWAIGYPYLYAMYRILNNFKPKNILELGLGQSTVMISRYARKYRSVNHTVVEHDQDWIDFFCKEFPPLPENSKIVRLDREFIDYNNASGVRVFKGFTSTFRNKTFDFISIDAPLGGDMNDYSRIDVLLMLPNILAKDFVIMIDDTNRKQERNTIAAMTKCLSDNGINFKVGRYKGQKECTIICAEHLGFFTSM